MSRPKEPAFYSKPAFRVKPARAWLRKLNWRDLKTLREVKAEKYGGDWCDERTDDDFKRYCKGEGKLPPLVAQVRSTYGQAGYAALTDTGEIVLELDRERMIDQIWDLLPKDRRDEDADGHRYLITSRGHKYRIDEYSDQDLESTILERGGKRPGYERSRNPRGALEYAVGSDAYGNWRIWVPQRLGGVQRLTGSYKTQAAAERSARAYAKKRGHKIVIRVEPYDRENNPASAKRYAHLLNPF